MTYVVTTSPPDPLFGEVADMLTDVVADEDRPVTQVADDDLHSEMLDPSCRLILVGDGLLFPRAASLLSNGGPRPGVTLWQLEPFPASAVVQHLADEQSSVGAPRVAAAVEGIAYRGLRRVVPPAVRRVTRKVQRRLLPESANQALGDARRLERVRWIEDAVRDGWLDTVCVSSPDRREILASRGVSSTFVPIGHHRYLEPRATGRARDIDVLFLGRVKRTRVATVRRLRQDLKQAGVELTIETGPVYGRARAELLGRTRVSLSLVASEQELTRFRVVASMAARAAVVAEEVESIAPFDDRHLVTAGRDELADAVLDLLADEEKRTRLAARAYDFVVEEVSMRRSAHRLLGVS